MNSDVKLAAPAPDDGYPPGYSRQPQEGARGDAPDVAALREFVGRYVTAMLACAGMRRASDRDAKRQLDLKADAAGRVLDSALVALGARDELVRIQHTALGALAAQEAEGPMAAIAAWLREDISAGRLAELLHCNRADLAPLEPPAAPRTRQTKEEAP